MCICCLKPGSFTMNRKHSLLRWQSWEENTLDIDFSGTSPQSENIFTPLIFLLKTCRPSEWTSWTPRVVLWCRKTHTHTHSFGPTLEKERAVYWQSIQTWLRSTSFHFQDKRLPWKAIAHKPQKTEEIFENTRLHRKLRGNIFSLGRLNIFGKCLSF